MAPLAATIRSMYDPDVISWESVFEEEENRSTRRKTFGVRLRSIEIRSTTKIWVVTRHQYGISALVTQTSFCEGSSGDLAKRRLFSQAMTNKTQKDL